MCSTLPNCLETLSGQLAWLNCSKNQAVCSYQDEQQNRARTKREVAWASRRTDCFPPQWKGKSAEYSRRLSTATNNLVVLSLAEWLFVGPPVLSARGRSGGARSPGTGRTRRPVISPATRRAEVRMPLAAPASQTLGFVWLCSASEQ